MYHLVNMACFYIVSSAHQHATEGSLVDRGANGGIGGGDIRVIETSLCKVDVLGVDRHEVHDLPIVTAGAVVESQHGPLIAIMHQYACTGHGQTIHSAGQLEWYQNDVNDQSLKVPGGLQRITTPDGYVHPLNIINGLPYINMHPFTDEQWESLPHVIWTSDIEWDPCVLDHSLNDHDDWYDAISELES
jgi:hypothetical protein